MVSPIIDSFSCSAVFNVNNSEKPSYLTGICFIFCDDSCILRRCTDTFEIWIAEAKR